MRFDYIYDGDELSWSQLQPEENEDPDELYRYSRVLLVENPALFFTEKAKKGVFNYLSDEEYDVVLQRFKLISERIFCKKPRINIFKAFDLMMKLVLSGDLSATAGEEPSGHQPGPEEKLT